MNLQIMAVPRETAETSSRGQQRRQHETDSGSWCCGIDGGPAAGGCSRRATSRRRWRWDARGRRLRRRRPHRRWRISWRRGWGWPLAAAAGLGYYGYSSYGSYNDCLAWDGYRYVNVCYSSYPYGY